METLHTPEMILCIILILSTTPGVKSTNTIEMDEYPESIDDEFIGCKPEMYQKIKSGYLKEELEKNKEFNDAWNHAKRVLNLDKKNDDQLSEDDLRNVAIRMYTGDRPYKIYDKLNNKMQDGLCEYRTKFGLISLHFQITDAIQTLNPQGKCETTYHFSRDRLINKGKFVRFGSFGSSSRDPKLTGFGRVTCFVIRTCYGAYIAPKSAFPLKEEVLIPPYERFEMTKVENHKDLQGCKTIFILNSVGKESHEMKCEFLSTNLKKSIFTLISGCLGLG